LTVATFFDVITPDQAALLAEVPVFFVAIAAPDLAAGPDGAGAVNLSPKGGTTPLVLDERTVAWLDYVGSGDETGRHVTGGGPITLMAMATSAEDAAIVRLYGHAEVEELERSPLADRLLAASRMKGLKRARRVFVLHVERTMTSCGYGVPTLQHVGERTPAGRGRRFKAARYPAGTA
jgi:hypothetical protein